MTTHAKVMPIPEDDPKFVTAVAEAVTAVTADEPPADVDADEEWTERVKERLAGAYPNVHLALDTNQPSYHEDGLHVVPRVTVYRDGRPG